MSAKRIKIYLRSKGSLTYGWGHVVRSLTLSCYLNKSENSVRVLCSVEGDNAIKKFMSKQNVPFLCMNVGVSIKDEEHHLKEFEPDIIVIDMLEVPTELLSICRQNCRKLAIFNDLGLDYKIGDIIINPQLLSSYPVQRNGQRHLNGIDYFVIDEKMLQLRKQQKLVPTQVRSLLIVMGGCIHQQVFEILAKVIENIVDLGLMIYFLLGYAHDVDKDSINHLESMGTKCVFGTNKIEKLMYKADMAIASSGYVKYELAALGVPAILVSVVDHQETLGMEFVRKVTCAEYCGNIKKIDAIKIVEVVRQLAQDKERREKMAQEGRKLIDGKALERIEKELIG